MVRRICAFAAIVLAFGGVALAERMLTELPTGRKIAVADRSLTLGTLPSGIALSRDGRRAFVLEAGHLAPALRIIDVATLTTKATVDIPNAYGVPVRDGLGDGVWVAGTATFGNQIAHVDTDAARIDRTIGFPARFGPSAVAIASRGALLAVAGDLADRVALVDVASGALRAEIRIGRHPEALVFSQDGRTLFVAQRAENAIAAIDVADQSVRQIPTGRHPAALALDGDRLYVANADDDDIALVDTRTLRTIAHVALPWSTPGVVGSSPNALALDGDRLYVSCGAANAIAVYRRTATGLRALGAIPAGWYPTAVALAGTNVLIADGKGESGHPNPRFRPGGSGTDRDYVADNLRGALRAIARPADAELRDGLALVRELDAPIPAPPHPVLRANGPIRHVIYVIKENRTYDQVLGDIKEADGDPSLVMYGEAITPNQHAIARRFGIFDRFTEDAHVSADGHNWSSAAFANDYLEHRWPANYASRRDLYDFEDGADAATPPRGYLWDAALEQHLGVRDYGEFVTAGPGPGGVPVSTTLDRLRPHVDLQFPTFDTRITDLDRFAEWKREFDAYERTHTLPALEIVRFPRDHTAGTRRGEGTPRAMVADNDAAVGKLVETVSHSADWATTAIFVIEDDAQDGPDHVDEQRSTLYVASPYASGGVIHTHYTQASVLRTIETILGLRTLSSYDAGTAPMTAAFRDTSDLRPYDALPATFDLNEKNKPTAYGGARSDAFDLAHADRVDPAVMNEILWHDARGAATPPPFGAFPR